MPLFFVQSIKHLMTVIALVMKLDDFPFFIVAGQYSKFFYRNSTVSQSIDMYSAHVVEIFCIDSYKSRIEIKSWCLIKHQSNKYDIAAKETASYFAIVNKSATNGQSGKHSN